MEFETRALKWYWTILFVGYVAAVGYLLFKANPYLYSQSTLKSRASSFEEGTVTPQPSPKNQFPLEETPTGLSTWPYLTSGHANIANPEVTRGKSFREIQVANLNPQPPKDAGVVGFDATQVLMLDSENGLASYSIDGSLMWRYKISKDHLTAESPKPYVLMDSALVYLILSKGRIQTIQKTTGRPQWLMELDTDVLSEPWFKENSLIVTTLKDVSAAKNKKTPITELIFLDRSQGTLQKKIDGFENKGPFVQVLAPALKARIFVQGTRVFAINESKLNNAVDILWTVNLPEEAMPQPIVYENLIILTTQGNHLTILDGAKKGQTETEIDLEAEIGAEITPIPLTQRLAYLDKRGTLRVLDYQKGEKAWKYDLSIRGPLRHLWSARLKGAFIQEFDMKWVHKGWTIWSPCGSKQFCIYNPERGQLINRIELSGEPMAQPLVFDRKLIALIKKPGGELAISHQMEPSEIKRLGLSDPSTGSSAE